MAQSLMVQIFVPRRRVLFMAEKGCWPDWDMAFGRRFCLQRYPPAPGGLPYRFLNSGVWMGRRVVVVVIGRRPPPSPPSPPSCERSLPFFAVPPRRTRC